jgi:hypothetical protein
MGQTRPAAPRTYAFRVRHANMERAAASRRRTGLPWRSPSIQTQGNHYSWPVTKPGAQKRFMRR